MRLRTFFLLGCFIFVGSVAVQAAWKYNPYTGRLDYYEAAEAGAETDPVVGAITGIVKADGDGNISAASAGTDYVQTESDPEVGAVNGIVKSNGSAVFSAATPGTDYVVPAGNVATATALAANPNDCAANNFATTIAANGNLTCTQVTDATIDTGADVIVALITASFDGAGSAFATGFSGQTVVGYNATLSGWDLNCASDSSADVSDTIKIDVWKENQGSAMTDADSITNGHEPQLSAASYAVDTDITDWSDTTITAGQRFGFNVDTAPTGSCTKATLVLRGKKT